MSGAIGFALAPGRGGRRVRGYDFGGATLPPGANLSRASAGSRLSGPGAIETIGANVARFDRWPATGLIVEPAATNLAPASASIAGRWTGDRSGTGATDPLITPAADTAPDGGTADRIAFQRGTGFARISTSIGPVAAGAPFTFSLWIKGDEAGPGPAMRLDGTTGAALDLVPGWRRFTMSSVGSGGLVSCQLILWGAVPGSPAVVSLLAWGAQLELGGTATSIIPTSGAPATRAADVLTLDWARHRVPDGPQAFRYDLAGGSTVTVSATVAGGFATMPMPPAGERVVRIVAG